MRRMLLINSVCGIRSTGRICAAIAKEYEVSGWDVKIAYGREAYIPENCRKWAVRIGGKVELYLHAILARLWGDQGFGIMRSNFATRRFLKWAEEWNPDELWLHNLHGYYINVPMLFSWIKSRPNMRVRWTLHDCWAFTGGCGYFTYCRCRQWQDGCYRCPANNGNSRNGIISHHERRIWHWKRETFSGVRNLTLITPSQWLADLTRTSYLGCYPVEVRNNKIDERTFKPTPSDVRDRLGIRNHKVILGVAAQWTLRKGYDDFLALRQKLNDDYAIVLVGLSMKQMRQLPKGIIGIMRTNSTRELAELYSMADVFFNPTKEENYPTVNLEARACGCPIVTYDTGGCSETVSGYAKAIVLKDNDKNVDGFIRVLREGDIW